MGRFLDSLLDLIPRTGRLIREDGDFFNEADLLARQEATNLLLAVEDGRIYQASLRTQIPANSTLRFAQPVTNNDSIRGISFGGVFRGGPLEYRLYVGSTLGAIESTIPGYNADRRLIDTDRWESVNPIVRVASATGGTVIDRSFGESATTGVARSSAGLSALGLGGIYDANAQPCFTLENTSNAIVQIALTWVWKERG